MAGITTVEAANRFLHETWLPFHNRAWTVPAAGASMAFVPYTGGPLDRICALQYERVVGHDNCVEFEKRRLQIPKAAWRDSFARCRVMVYEHLDGTFSVGYGPHTLGCYEASGRPLEQPPRRERGRLRDTSPGTGPIPGMLGEKSVEP
ncbi:hypothetical protein [Nitrospira sp. Kam-Ns4a]